MSNMTSVVDKTLARINERKQREQFFNDPREWAWHTLGVDLWSKQAQIADSLVDNKSVAVKAGHGVGKSFLVAVLICWWIDTRYPNAFVASTAPSQKQIGAIVWREVRKLKNLATKRYKEGLIDHELPGYITADNEWKEEGGNILGFGRKPPENKEDDSFQGIHDGYVLAIGDEATGLSEELVDALGNITSNRDSRRILICNPTNPASYIGTLFKEQKSNWTFHTISVFDSPNITGEETRIPKADLAKLSDKDYVEEKKAEYGETSPRYKSRVLGEFAYDLGDTLIKPEDIAVAYDYVADPDSDCPVVLGIDVARFGKDASVIYKNTGGQIRYVDSLEGEARVTTTANWIHRYAIDLNAAQVRIDSLGIGGGVIDALMQLDPRYTVIEMNANATSPDRKQWHNARAFWWDNFRRDLREGRLDLDTDDTKRERLEDELLSVAYKFNQQFGGLLVESKDDMRKRGMKSPDFADACIYAGADLAAMTQDPLFGYSTGDKIRQSAADVIGDNMPHYLKVLSQF